MHSSFMVSSSIFLHFVDATVESQLCIILCVLCDIIVHLCGKNKTDTHKPGFECSVCQLWCKSVVNQGSLKGLRTVFL